VITLSQKVDESKALLAGGAGFAAQIITACSLLHFQVGRCRLQRVETSVERLDSALEDII
jgi:hypothetical protein